ncbi:MAG: DUF1566 domain-containing protein [Campylobacterales bacterium]|nr:DUF1566 domain-containing protein [Campylobacterales bacterium]
MKRSLIVVIFLSSLYGEYYKQGSMVTDKATAFQWQDEHYTQSELDAYSSGDSVDKVQSFEGAIEYCDDLVLDGYDDWRLPNFTELYLLAQRNATAPSIDATFQNVPIGKYWSSTTSADQVTQGWIVDFEYGNSELLDKSSSAYVRCIRN